MKKLLVECGQGHPVWHEAMKHLWAQVYEEEGIFHWKVSEKNSPKDSWFKPGIRLEGSHCIQKSHGAYVGEEDCRNDWLNGMHWGWMSREEQQRLATDLNLPDAKGQSRRTALHVNGKGLEKDQVCTSESMAWDHLKRCIEEGCFVGFRADNGDVVWTSHDEWIRGASRLTLSEKDVQSLEEFIMVTVNQDPLYPHDRKAWWDCDQRAWIQSPQNVEELSRHVLIDTRYDEGDVQGEDEIMMTLTWRPQEVRAQVFFTKPYENFVLIKDREDGGMIVRNIEWDILARHRGWTDQLSKPLEPQSTRKPFRR